MGGFFPQRSLNGAWLGLMLLAAGLHFASFEVVETPIGLDVAFFLYFAERVAQGAVPYVDFLEYKTPLAIFVGAWAYRTGEVLGLDPLVTIRVCFLGLASLTAVASGVALFHAANRRVAAAWLGLLGYAGFGVLGCMPAIGNVPKQLTMLCAALALLQARRRRWLTCGALVALAGMDWQVGGALAGTAVLTMALATPGRRRAILRIGLGALLALAPFLAYFGWHRALPAFWEQVVVAPGMRLESGRHSNWEFARILEMLGRAASPDLALCWLAAGGLLLATPWVLRARGTPRLPLTLGLCVYHGLVVFWSSRSFAARGDLFLLLGSCAFFGALTLTSLFLLALYWLRRARPHLARKGALPAVISVLGTVLLLHPSFLGGDRRWDATLDSPPYDLSDQREVAREFAKLARDRRVACLASQELLFLERIPEVLGIVYFESTVGSYLSEDGEQLFDALISALDAADPTLIVFPGWFRLGKHDFVWEASRRYKLRTLSSSNGRYTVDVQVSSR